jgi:glycosyltransferase involved in cell wall biosynthesis
MHQSPILSMHGSSSQRPVIVLMSTYNGDRFIIEQLRSILDQLPVGGRIVIRDDGSTDQTVAKVVGIRDERISVIQGENIGFARSFLTLLRDATDHADVVMFADQDDVWLPGKIERARTALANYRGSPALYCSAQMLTDDELRPAHATQRWPRRPCFENALSENVVTGCTAALNPAAVELIKPAGVPQRVKFHDWWLYLVVSAFGTVIFDEEPTLLYRQHDTNQIGHGAGWWGRQRRVLRFLGKHDWVGIMLGQVADLLQNYGSRLDPRRADLLGHLFLVEGSGIQPRWNLVFGLQRRRQYFFGELTFRALVAGYLLGLWPPAAMRLRD